MTIVLMVKKIGDPVDWIAEWVTSGLPDEKSLDQDAAFTAFFFGFTTS